MPTSADRRGGKAEIIPFAPRTSFAQKRPLPAANRLAGLIAADTHNRSPEAWQMAAGLLDALSYAPADDVEMARELGNYATAFAGLLAEGWGSQQMDWFNRELRKRSARARSRRPGNFQAYMRRTFANLACDMRRKFHRSRASPAAG